MSDVCRCSHDAKLHSYEEPTVCSIISCRCVNFISAKVQQPVISYIDTTKQQFKTIKDKMRWILENFKWFRNYTNKDLVIAWWHFVNQVDLRKHILSKENYYKLDEPETVTRSRRLLVELNPELYGPFLGTYEEHKLMRQYGIEEFITEHK